MGTLSQMFWPLFKHTRRLYFLNLVLTTQTNIQNTTEDNTLPAVVATRFPVGGKISSGSCHLLACILLLGTF